MSSDFLSRLRRTARRARLTLLLTALWMPAAVTAQQGFASLEEQMTGEEFRAAGLEKLTPEELAALNEWIRAHSLATLDSPKYAASGSVANTGGSEDSAPPAIEEMERKPIVTRINGSFSGWDGQTVFRLENGMIWAQADKDKFYTQEIRNPTVTIKPALFGAWKLSVEGYDEECRVERIQ